MTCPHCGASQEESAKVLSTICRDCGEYFKVEAAPSEGGSFGLSGLFRRRKPPENSYFMPSIGSDPVPRERVAIREDEHVEPFYAHEYFLPPEEETPEDDPMRKRDEDNLFALNSGARVEDEEEGDAGYEVIDVDSGASDSVSGGGAGDADFVRSMSSTVPERTTRCFECGTTLHYSAKASSTICSHCSAYISLEDVEVLDHRRTNVKTRGDLTIDRNGSLGASEIACNTLRVFGRISGKLDCFGDAYFRSSGQVVGDVRCRHLYIHKTCDLKFVPGVRAETAEVHGRMEGDLICEGTIKISATGAVIGDCIAPAIQMDPGGSLSGQMKIMKPDQGLQDDYERKAQAAHDQFLEDWQGEFEDTEIESELPDSNAFED